MKIYIVERVCNEEYGNTEVERVFANERDAFNYVVANQFTWRAWWNGKERKGLSYREWEVE